MIMNCGLIRDLVGFAFVYVALTSPMSFLSRSLPDMLTSTMKIPPITVALGRLLITAPWIFKPLWASRYDVRGEAKQRKVTLVKLLCLGSLASSITALFAYYRPEELVFWTIPAFSIAASCATADIAADGLSIVSFDLADQPRANAVQVAGMSVAQVLGAGVLSVFGQLLGVAGCFGMLAGSLLFAALSAGLLIRPHDKADRFIEKNQAESSQSQEKTQQSPISWSWCLLVLVIRMSSVAAESQIRPFLGSLGLDLRSRGWVAGVFGQGLSSSVGSMLAGLVIIPSLGTSRALGACVMSQALIVGSVLPLVSDISMATIIVILFYCIDGCMTTALFTSFAERSRTSKASRDFSYQQALFAAGHFAVAPGAILFGRFGFMSSFLTLAAPLFASGVVLYL